MNDRERLFEMISNVPCGTRRIADYYIKSTIESIADYLTRHGVTVQKHGRWYWDADGETGHNIRRCSKCHDGSGWAFNYCPNCGAKMDGEVDE